MDEFRMPQNDNIISFSQDLTSAPAGIVSDKVLNVMTTINFAVICGILFVFGSVTNIINIIVFFKIGFKDPINISLEVLAISDLGCCFSLLLFTLCFNPLFRKLDLPFDPRDFHYFSGWVHIAFARITSIATAFITFERCLCVVAPLKVKDIITPKRVVIVLSCSIVLVVGSITPHFFTARHVWRFIPERNKSILIVEYLEDGRDVDNAANSFHSIFIPIAVFFVVVISTMVLVSSLRQKTKWRESVTKSSTPLSTRDAKVSKMVLNIAILFIICYIPIFISYIAMLVEPQYDLEGRYSNMFVLMFSFHFALESTNSSLNFFIYYRMSSSYKTVLLQLFGRKKSVESNQ